MQYFPPSEPVRRSIAREDLLVWFDVPRGDDERALAFGHFDERRVVVPFISAVVDEARHGSGLLTVDEPIGGQSHQVRLIND